VGNICSLLRGHDSHHSVEADLLYCYPWGHVVLGNFARGTTCCRQFGGGLGLILSARRYSRVTDSESRSLEQLVVGHSIRAAAYVGGSIVLWLESGAEESDGANDEEQLGSSRWGAIGGAPMCDYSLQNVITRPAKVGDKLFTRQFSLATRGFRAPEDVNVAVCLMPGTELSFANEAGRSSLWPWSKNIVHHTTAIFRQVNLAHLMHADA
jgi:hypothetical protein